MDGSRLPHLRSAFAPLRLSVTLPNDRGVSRKGAKEAQRRVGQGRSFSIRYHPFVPYIVDGNNVIGHASGWEIGSSSSRRRLIDEVAAFVVSTREKVTLVFDGAPEDRIPDGSWHRGILVRYSRRGSNADRVVSSLVAESTDRRRLTVVTSDRQLATECRSRGAKTLGSDEFRRLVAHRQRQGPPVSDPGAAARPAEVPVDDWFRYFGLEPEAEPAPRKSPPRRRRR
ncbi:MAG: NYN domain-containing protein [Blastocatellia bacterium]